MAGCRGRAIGRTLLRDVQPAAEEMTSILKSAAAVAVVCLASACTSGSSLNDPASANAPTSPSSPTPPAGPPTETFSGSLDRSGTNFHFFATAQTGDVDVALPATAPSASSIVLLGLGVPSADGVDCSLKFSYLVVFAKAGTSLALPAAVGEPAGPYCVAIEDQMNVGPLTYTIQVWHH
jgi:hypothetical protein